MKLRIESVFTANPPAWYEEGPPFHSYYKHPDVRPSGPCVIYTSHERTHLLATDGYWVAPIDFSGSPVDDFSFVGPCPDYVEGDGEDSGCSHPSPCLSPDHADMPVYDQGLHPDLVME